MLQGQYLLLILPGMIIRRGSLTRNEWGLGSDESDTISGRMANQREQLRSHQFNLESLGADR
jgi:hypothetical protein